MIFLYLTLYCENAQMLHVRKIGIYKGAQKIYARKNDVRKNSVN